MIKQCTKCKTERPVEEFTKATGRSDGLNPWCKLCTRANTKAYSKSNPEAARKRGKKWYAENKDRRLAKANEWIKNNPGKSAEYSKRWRVKNPGAQAESERKWYENNRVLALEKDRIKRETNLELFLIKERESYAKHKDKRAIRNKNWRLANPHKITYYASARRSALAKRTPGWLTEKDFIEMQAFFIHAKDLEKLTGVIHHVDHIIPLRGRYVSGLNVPNNLQVLPAIVNLRKNNGYST